MSEPLAAQVRIEQGPIDGGSTTGSMTNDEANNVDLATLHVHEAIRAMLADEVPDLADSKAGLKILNDPYLHIGYESFKSYLHFLFDTWTGVSLSFFHALQGKIQVRDFIALAFFSGLISMVLTMGVIGCLICKLPIFERLARMYAGMNGGYSLTNSLNVDMFTSLTRHEVRLCKAALASTVPPKGREFNLEVAKMLLLISSVVYERTSEGTRETLRVSQAVPRVPHNRRKGSNSPKGFSSPKGMSPAASPRSAGWGFPITPTSPGSPPMSPAPMSQNNSSSSAKRHSTNRYQHQHHVRSLSHLSQHIASHLHSPNILQSFTSPDHQSPIPLPNLPKPDHLLKVFGKSATAIRNMLHGSQGDNVIQNLVAQLGVEYEPVSELNSASSSYASVFWDKNSNWIVLAFKGTSPSEFDEWLTDFDVTRVEAGHHLPSYKQIHRGFKKRLFPEHEVHHTPYDTIISSLKVVAKDLMSRTDKPINVWFTGHSLGCAMATLTYTRALMGLDGLHPRIQLCDAYLYGAPVVCDMASAKVFNQYMKNRHQKSGRLSTIWRVTNRLDAVTTLLPMLGDDPLYPYPSNMFAYAHLGAEVRMRPGKGTSIIIDNYVDQNEVPARVVSCADMHLLSDDETETEESNEQPIGLRGRRMSRGDGAVDAANPPPRKGKNKHGVGVPWWIAMMEYLPLYGRMVSHFPGLYYRSLQQMEPGDLVWRRR
ncbi:alpha/beta-hydrolase [Serendipita vermifera]|nr:alpha/beta-hydrolase [Serendipita vermifera]